MQIEGLNVFADVARLRSFSQAAVANGISQSAVSQLVSLLEKRLGVKLVDRSVRPLRLTEAGRLFTTGCQDIVRRYQELENAVRGDGATPEHVQVAAIYSVGLRDMHQYVERFARESPGGQVRIDYLHPNRVYERVLEGSADLGLVSFPRKTRELSARPWRQEEMVVVCAPVHPLAEQTLVAPERLNGMPFVAFDRGLTIRREIDRFLREHDTEVEVVLEFDNIETIKRAVAETGAVALLPRPTLRPETDHGALKAIPLEGCRLVRPLGMIHRRQGVSAATERFMRILNAVEYNGELAAGPAGRQPALNTR